MCVQVRPGRYVYVLCFYILAIFFLVIFLSSCFLVYSKYLCCICSKYRKKHHFNCVMISSDLICHCKHCCGSSVLCTNSWKIANGSKNVSFYGRRIRHTSGNGCCKWKMIFCFSFILIALHSLSKSEITSRNIWVFLVCGLCVSKAMFDFSVVLAGTHSDTSLWFHTFFNRGKPILTSSYFLSSRL